MKRRGDRTRRCQGWSAFGQLCDPGQVFPHLALTSLALAKYRDHPNTVPNTENTQLSFWRQSLPCLEPLLNREGTPSTTHEESEMVISTK